MNPECNHRSPYKREAEGHLAPETEGNVTTEAKRYIVASEDGERGHKPRIPGNASLEAGKGEEKGSPLKPKGVWPC